MKHTICALALLLITIFVLFKVYQSHHTKMVTYIYSDGSQWYDVVTLQEYENRTFVAPNAKDTIVKVFDTETGKAIYAAPIGEVPRRISTY